MHNQGFALKAVILVVTKTPDKARTGRIWRGIWP